MPYIEGKSFRFRHTNGQEQAILALYGDQNAEGAGWAMEAATAQHPRQAALSDRQMISVWFKFDEVRPYGEVDNKVEKVFEHLEASGWTLSCAVQGMSDTGCSVGGLVDTADFMYRGPGEDYPEHPSSHGYNAAESFVVVAERPNQAPVFTGEELDQTCQLMEKLGQMVFGHSIFLKEE